MPRATGELMLRDLAPQWLSGGELYRDLNPLITLTKGVRVVVSTDWLVLGLGVIDHIIWF